MIELTEDSVKDFIKEGVVVIKAWGDGCGYCDKYAPTFEKVMAGFPEIKVGSIKVNLKEPSEFKRTYMKNDKGGEKNSIPATFLFEGGEFKRRIYGNLTEEKLISFINDEVIEEAPKGPSMIELKAMAYDMIGQIEVIQNQYQQRLQPIQNQLNQVNQQIARLQQPGMR